MFAVCTSPAAFTYLDLNWRFVFAISLVSYAGKGLSWQLSGRTWAIYSSLHTLAELNASLPHVWRSGGWVAHITRHPKALNSYWSDTHCLLLKHQFHFYLSHITEHRKYRVSGFEQKTNKSLGTFVISYFIFAPFIKWFPQRASGNNRQQRCHSGFQSSCLTWVCRALVLDPLGKIAFGCESHSLLSASRSCEGYK